MSSNIYVLALIAGAAHGVFVFFKAFQQRNVMGMHYKLTIAVSYFMAMTEVFVLSIVAVSAVEAVKTGDITRMAAIAVALGTFGAIGAVTGMWTHHRYVGVKR